MDTTVSPLKAAIMYVLTSLFLFFEMAVQVSPSVMTGKLMHDLNVGVVGLGIMSGCYFYSYTLMQVPSGMLFDRFKPRHVIVAALLVCALGCLSLGSAPNVYLAALGRLLTGFGSAFAFVSVLVITADLFPSKYFATLTGVTQMMAAFGAMSGQLPVHWLVDSLGWRHTYFTFAAIAVVLAVAIWLLLSYRRKVRAFSAKEKTSFSKIKTIIKQPQTWWVALYACLLWAPMSTFASLWGVPYLRHVDGLSADSAAMVCSMMWLGLAAASPLLGYIASTKWSKRQGLTLSALLGCIAFGLLLLLKLPAVVLGTLLFLSGAACAGQALSFTVVKNQNHDDSVASAIAFNNMAVVISGALFQPLAGFVLHAFAGMGQRLQYQYGLSMVWLVYLIAFLLAWLVIKPRLIE